MAYSSYILHKLLGPLWTWEATFRSEERRGYAFGKEAAQKAARQWLRARRDRDLERRKALPE